MSHVLDNRESTAADATPGRTCGLRRHVSCRHTAELRRLLTRAVGSKGEHTIKLLHAGRLEPIWEAVVTEGPSATKVYQVQAHMARFFRRRGCAAPSPLATEQRHQLRSASASQCLLIRIEAWPIGRSGSSNGSTQRAVLRRPDLMRIRYTAVSASQQISPTLGAFRSSI